jgi:hypothetical protein
MCCAKFSLAAIVFPHGGGMTSGERDMEKNDLIELARICLKHARATSVRRAAAALKRMAKDYQRRAGLLGTDPSPQGNRARRRRPPRANELLRTFRTA